MKKEKKNNDELYRDYRYESRRGPFSRLASTNSCFVTKNPQK
jgi:hypothetical protein